MRMHCESNLEWICFIFHAWVADYDEITSRRDYTGGNQTQNLSDMTPWVIFMLINNKNVLNISEETDERGRDLLEATASSAMLNAA